MLRGLEAVCYQPYLISLEKGLRSLIKGVLELEKEPSRLCVDEVHRVLIDIVLDSSNATPGLGRYPPFNLEVIAIATTALEGFKNEAKIIVVALVDMGGSIFLLYNLQIIRKVKTSYILNGKEYVFVSDLHLIRLII
ncbi:hypothetical protein ACS0TY_013550 [Phlomoides rotata]